MSQSGLEGMKPSHRPATEHGGKRRQADGRRDGHAAIAGFDQFGAVRVRANPIAESLLGRLRRAEAFGIG